MSQKMANQETITCRGARRQSPALLAVKEARVVPIRQALSAAERASIERHLETCEGCAMEYRLLALSRATLDAAAVSDMPAPDEDFFKAVRARLHRGEPAVERADESWTAALFVTARQLIPAMALLLLLIIGATFLWSSAAPKGGQPLQSTNHLPRLFDDPAPSVDDALDSVMAIEEKKNGK
ncbi:MAG: anti-sigma factor family protein [Blastocatellia bacterium]